MAQKQRTYGAAHFALELDDNKNVGFFRSIEGGGLKTEIAGHRVGSSHREWRQLGPPKYDDLKVEVGMAMSGPFYDWISSFFRGEVVRKSGAVVAGDFHYNERARREMYEMLISEVTLPTLDAQDKNACHMGVTLVPERVIFKPGTNRKIDRAKIDDKQKMWTPSNFMFRLDGFDDACKRVAKIDSFTIKQEILEHRVGNLRDAIRVPGHLEFPNINIHVPESDGKKFVDHFVKHAQDGAIQVAPRLTGEIEFRNHDGKGLCSVSLAGIDIASIEPAKSDSSSDDVKLIKVELAVEDMSFKYLA